MSLSVSVSKLNVALSTMGDTIAALRQSTMDDIQLSARYADLLEMCIEGLREKFVPCGPGGQATASGEQMRMEDRGSAQAADGTNLFDRSDAWEMDWLQLPVDPSLLATDPFDPYGFSWLDEKSLDFLQTLDDWPTTA